jgi:hypothetical protein
MSVRKKESIKKLNESKKDVKSLQNNKRLLNKEIDNSFRIILPLKMAEIIEFKN